MMPFGPLMTEHRVIEKMIPLIRREAERGRREGRIEIAFVDLMIDFFRAYADRCHHGKEEDLLFRALDRKPLKPGHRAVLNELLEEHRISRTTLTELDRALDTFRGGDQSALSSVLDRLESLAALYPPHIYKEDARFFIPSMDYFDAAEREALIAAEREFDRKLIHELYHKKLETAARLIEAASSAPRS